MATDPVVTILQLAGFKFGTWRSKEGFLRIYTTVMNPYLSHEGEKWLIGARAFPAYYVERTWGELSIPPIPIGIAQRLIEVTYGDRA